MPEDVSVLAYHDPAQRPPAELPEVDTGERDGLISARNPWVNTLACWANPFSPTGDPRFSGVSMPSSRWRNRCSSAGKKAELPPGEDGSANRNDGASNPAGSPHRLAPAHVS